MLSRQNILTTTNIVIKRLCKNNVPEITDLLQYWQMLEIFLEKALVDLKTKVLN